MRRQLRVWLDRLEESMLGEAYPSPYRANIMNMPPVRYSLATIKRGRSLYNVDRRPFTRISMQFHQQLLRNTDQTNPEQPCVYSE